MKNDRKAGQVQEEKKLNLSKNVKGQCVVYGKSSDNNAEKSVFFNGLVKPLNEKCQWRYHSLI